MYVMLPHFKSELLAQIPYVTHGFFTRNGGVSTDYHATLSTSSMRDENKDYVAENKRRIQLVLRGKQIHFERQDHTTLVREITMESNREPGDGLISRTPGLLIGVNTADCMPILIAHPDMPVVAAVHAGWKGLLSGVIEATLDHLATLCDISELYCAIGPCISVKHLEVGEEVYDTATMKRFFIPTNTPHKWHLDMAAYATYILQTRGITHIDHINQDTYSQPELFFSYRRTTHTNEPTYGLQASVIGINLA